MFHCLLYFRVGNAEKYVGGMIGRNYKRINSTEMHKSVDLVLVSKMVFISFRNVAFLITFCRK
jgi:hypothetical protein